MLTSASSCKTMRVIWAPCRITPACAGNRVETSHAPPPKKNHPRLRGEQRQAPTNMPMCRGSPPLARGTGTCPPCRCWAHRITPACAGNSIRHFAGDTIFWDHPRLRGEQFSQPPACAGGLGSPPLARGTGSLSQPFSICVRITPACAGNRCGRQTRRKPV